MLAPSSSKDLKWKQDNKTEKSEIVMSVEPLKASSFIPTITTATTTSSAPSKDLNQLMARSLKAKEAGDMKLYESLQKELETARAEQAKQTEVVIPLDERGRPIQLSASDQVPATRRGKFDTIDKDGSRLRYYRDDEASLQELMAREKMQGGNDYNANFAKNIMNKANYKVMLRDVDELTFINSLTWTNLETKQRCGSHLRNASQATNKRQLKRKEPYKVTLTIDHSNSQSSLEDEQNA
jgi:hypothetical protein